MKVLFVFLVAVAVLVISLDAHESFEPNASKLAVEVKTSFDRYVAVQKGGVERVVMTQARIVGTTPPGISGVFASRPVWNARIRVKPKLITTSGVFIGHEIVMDGTGPTEDDAVYDAKRGISLLRKELEDLY